MRRVLLTFALIGLLMVAVTALLLPSPATLDVSFESDVVEFQTERTLGEALAFNLGDAVVCGELDPLAIKGTESSPCGARLDLSNISNPKIRTPPAAKITMRRPNARELELSIVTAGTGNPIRIISATGETTAKSVFVRIPLTFFETGKVVALGALTSMVRIGSSGRTFGETNGLLLLKGVSTPIVRSILSDSVVMGTPINLNMGDVIDYTAQDGSAERANLFLRVSKKGAIVGTARIPISSLTIRRLGGGGIPVSVSWWFRFLAEPILIAAWAALGFFSTAFAVLGKLIGPFSKKQTDPDLS